MASSIRVTIHVPPELWDAIKVVADANKCSCNAIVRQRLASIIREAAKLKTPLNCENLGVEVEREFDRLAKIVANTGHELPDVIKRVADHLERDN